MKKSLTFADVWPLFRAYCQLPGNMLSSLQLFDDWSGRVVTGNDLKLYLFHDLEDLRSWLVKETAR